MRLFGKPNTIHVVMFSFRNEFHSFRTILFQDNTRQSFGCTCSWGSLSAISVWTLVPVRLGKQLSDHSTVDDFASEAADCRHIHTMANCPQKAVNDDSGPKGFGRRSMCRTPAGL
ncbi:hypothetical protein TNCV_3818331 [Trichonephila clavipes]|nr:hypothetical protein TNCV_3818331 [Trichonephila clavipes]